MRGYCPDCREYRGDMGEDAWHLIWMSGLPICERCGAIIEVWEAE